MSFISLYFIFNRLEKSHPISPRDAPRNSSFYKDFLVIAALSSVTCPITLSADVFVSFTSKSIFQKLDAGSFGQVFISRLRESSDVVAIKQPIVPSYCNPAMVCQEQQMNHVRTKKESLVHQLLSGSPYTPNMHGIIKMGGDSCLVQEFIGDKDSGKTYPLYKLFEDKPTMKVSEFNMVEMAADMMNGLQELHGRGLLHNDIKGNNVLMEKRGVRWHAVLIDFGLVSTIGYPYCRRVSPAMKEAYRKNRGRVYLPPEMILHDQPASIHSDIYSLGLLLLKMGRVSGVAVLVSLGEDCTKDEPHLRPESVSSLLYRVDVIKADLEAAGKQHKPSINKEY